MFSAYKDKVSHGFIAIMLGMTLLLQGCPIVAVAIIAAYNDDGGITVTVEVPRSAPDVYKAAQARLQKGVSVTGIPYKVVHSSDENYTIGVEGTDGSWRGEFIVVPITSARSQIIALGSDDNREKHESENLILMGIENLCDDLGVNYTVVDSRTAMQ